MWRINLILILKRHFFETTVKMLYCGLLECSGKKVRYQKYWNEVSFIITKTITRIPNSHRCFYCEVLLQVSQLKAIVKELLYLTTRYVLIESVFKISLMTESCFKRYNFQQNLMLSCQHIFCCTTLLKKMFKYQIVARCSLLRSLLVARYLLLIFCSFLLIFCSLLFTFALCLFLFSAYYCLFIIYFI